MPELTVHAPDIECEGCANSIKRAVGKMNGVDTVDVDIAKKDITVHYARDLFMNREKLEETLDRIGFPIDPE